MEEEKENKREIKADIRGGKKEENKIKTEDKEQIIKEEKLKQVNKGEEEKRNREESKKNDYLREQEDKRKKAEAKRIKDESEKNLRDEYLQEKAKRINQEEIKTTEAKFPASGVKIISTSPENKKVFAEVEQDLTWTCACMAANSCEWEICMKCESLKPGLSGWVCSRCKFRNEENSYKCKCCSTEKGKEINKINEYWTCPMCKSAISTISKVCPDCRVSNNELGENKIKQPTQDSKLQIWECSYCGTKNNLTVSRCIQCSSVKGNKIPSNSKVYPKKSEKNHLVDRKSANNSKPEPVSSQAKPKPISNPLERPISSNVLIEGSRRLVKQPEKFDTKPEKQPDNRYIYNKATKELSSEYMTSEPVASKYSPIEQFQVDFKANKAKTKSANENIKSLTWNCDCGRINESFEIICACCYRTRSSISDWSCAKCSAKNSVTLSICNVCCSRKNEPVRYVEKAFCKGCGFSILLCECENKSIEFPKKVSEQIKSLDSERKFSILDSERKFSIFDDPDSKTSDKLPMKVSEQEKLLNSKWKFGIYDDQNSKNSDKLSKNASGQFNSLDSNSEYRFSVKRN